MMLRRTSSIVKCISDPTQSCHSYNLLLNTTHCWSITAG